MFALGCLVVVGELDGLPLGPFKLGASSVRRVASHPSVVKLIRGLAGIEACSDYGGTSLTVQPVRRRLGERCGGNKKALNRGC
jgi:hypothetical protein